MTYAPYRIVGEDLPGRFVVICDHAANTVPAAVGGGSLGLRDEDMQRHIAYDPGAAAVSLALAEVLGAPAVLSNFSRLVIDPNRGEDDPTLVMRLYDGTIIPANREAGPEEIERRKSLCYLPYHDAVERVAVLRDDPVMVSVHSFTPQLRGRGLRPWQVGVLHSHRDTRLAMPLLHALEEQGGLTVGDNQPYGGHLPGDSMDRHALSHGRPNALIELRQDLIEDEAAQREWAERLALALDAAVAQAQV
ncbi:N-formylglutamate amidohydrolase [Tropicimonas sp. IMCC34011]|uniref:N-formylglutamate amidohydrolase n=1 Tax=Tropicimonas sp. IMCC34011 TaxID=2248759 RepID=UPI000E22DDAC|nr:N-formylglutamate amidohydrolase [Tropicimonas sp. IMCC34011]